MYTWLLPIALTTVTDDVLDPALATITSDDLRARLEVIAADEMGGRLAGTERAQKAADYCAAHFGTLGLEPAGDDGTYFQSFEFPVRGGGASKAQTVNVVARLPGSDPAFADRAVVIGAHYDHVGRRGDPDAGRMGAASDDDEIWNGADDNGSGTTSVLEIAEAFVSGGLKPKRTVYFVLFGAEEQGLFGSQYFVTHPPIPIESIRAAINMDMVGRNGDRPLRIDAAGSLPGGLWGYFCKTAVERSGTDLEFETSSYSPPNSDHENFIRMQVPAVALFTGLHPDYHKPSDHVARIDFDRMQSICRFATSLLTELADTDENLVFESPVAQAKPTNSLGINHDGALGAKEMAQIGFTDDQGGYLIRTIRSGSASQRASMRPGDIILAVSGRNLSPDDPATSLRRFIRGAGKGKDVAISVFRNGEVIELTAFWPKNR